MAKEEVIKDYTYFRFFVNLMVFICLLILLYAVEIKNIKQRIGFIPGLVPALLITSLFLILTLLTIFPHHDNFVGTTLIIVGIIILIANIAYYLKTGVTNLNLATESLMAIVLFMYGIDLKKKKGSFISLNILAERIKGL